MSKSDVHEASFSDDVAWSNERAHEHEHASAHEHADEHADDHADEHAHEHAHELALHGCSRAEGRSRGDRSRSRSRVVMALVAGAFAAVSLAPREAKAEDGAALIVGTVIGLTIADITFTTYDVIAARNNELPEKKWAIAELLVTLPQSGILGGVTAGFTLGREPEVSLGVLPFSIFTNTLTAHSILTLSAPQTDPAALFYMPPALGADLTFTASALAAMFGKRRVFTFEMGIAEALLTAPQVIGGIYKLGLKDTYVPTWAAFTGWSAALMIHGLVSIGLDRGGDYDGFPDSSDSGASGRGKLARRDKRPWIPSVDGIAPGPVAYAYDGSTAYGLVMRGSF